MNGVEFLGPLQVALPSETAAAATPLPARAELFTVSQLGHHAGRLAAWHTVVPHAPRGRRAPRAADRLLPRLADTEVMFASAYALITDAITRGRRLTPAGEWFIDNYPLIEEQILTARRHLPRGYSAELPRLTNASVHGTPRVYDIAIELISHAHGRVDLEGLTAFVAAYQVVCPLRLGELWAVPIMLRLAVLENLRRIVAAIVDSRHERERADHWAERMLDVAATRPREVVLVLAELVKEDKPLTNAFAAALASRLQGQAHALVFAMTWLEQRLAERGLSVANVFQLAGQSQAEDQVAIGNSITSLRFIGATDWRTFVEAASTVERALRADPSYGAMAFETRDQYRHVVERVARRSALTEQAIAQAAVELAAAARDGPAHDLHATRRGHVGYFLIDDGLDALCAHADAPSIRRHGARAFARYATAVVTVTAGLTAAFVLSATDVIVGDLARAATTLVVALCTSQMAVAITQWVVALSVKPEILPRLDFAKGIRADHAVVIAVPTLLSSIDAVDHELEAMEVRFLANRDPHLSCALLSDFPDAPRAEMAGDDAILARAVEGVRSLNARYGSGAFHLFHRARTLNAREGCFMGWERKRGKLEDFNGALRGVVGRFHTIEGDLAALQRVPYVIVLDSDTDLPRDAAALLAATMAHPLNRPVWDAAAGRVVAGYSILQPRVGVTMASSSSSLFARLFAGEPGIDPYTRAVSDTYQDLCGEGSFIGKGIYDVDAVQRAVGGRFPENCILSHDLLEGAYARSGLVTDVILVEGQPAEHAGEVARRARWIRGDWQILPWLFPRVTTADGTKTKNPISFVSRWKILDNLRRSLAPAALFTVLLVGWSMPETAFAATLLSAGTVFLPGILHAAVGLWRRPDDQPRHLHLGNIAGTFGRQLLRDALCLAWLPYDALISVDAVARAGVRMWVTKRRMLEWRTAADVARAARRTFAGTAAAMWLAPVTGLIVAVGLALCAPASELAAGPVVVLWIAAPGLAWWVSLPTRVERPALTPSDLMWLERLARRTWQFFGTFVTGLDNDLPPDNFQEEPPQGIAHRTSPTNIGLSLTAALAAHDFGFVPAGALLQRTARTLATMDKLARHRGHFYNWYDTQTLVPLKPLYVSTVDSGNLAGHLLVLAVGLVELVREPIVHARVWRGLRAAMDLHAEAVAALDESTPAPSTATRLVDADPPSGLRAIAARLHAVSSEAALLPRQTPELARWADATIAQCTDALADLAQLAPWLLLPDSSAFDEVVTLDVLARTTPTPAGADDGAAARALVAAVQLGAVRATERISEIGRLASRCREFADIDYAFLYDGERHLLSIGRDVDAHRLDGSFYDLLASEARLASYLAIAQGKLPQEHWFRLGRSLTLAGRAPALISWSGSMFEYLMPLLIMPSWKGTLLESTCDGVVKRQIEYGKERGIAWGVSESGYAKTDAALNYQYQAFGIPGLGFKRGLANDVVVAPYASALALMIDPAAATANLRRLEREGRLGAHGFYEAIDHTPARLQPGKSAAVVRSYMAHHQGMTFLALASVLLDRPMQRRFSADPALRATDLLLQERIPKGPPLYPRADDVSIATGEQVEAVPNSRTFSTPNTAHPEVHLLSNGSYHVAVTNAGGGSSRFRDVAVTRWREDATRDCWGSFCYVRDVDRGEYWSTGHQPTLKRATSSQAVFSQGRAELRRVDGDIECVVEIGVSPEDDVELRRVSIRNRGRAPRTIELTSYAEVVLAPAAADVAHPAFSNLFVQTEIVRDASAILCTRRPRSGGEHPLWMLHMMTVHGAVTTPPSFETARDVFVGRGRTVADPAAMYTERLSDSQGSVLDPIVSVRNTVVIAPHATVKIDIITGVSETREHAGLLVEKYTDRHSSDRLLELAWTHSQVVLRQLDVNDADTQLYERLASNVLYSNPTLRGSANVVAKNRMGQSALWPYGISGDLPIVLVRIGDVAEIELVHQLIKAHAYWRLKGLAVELVIWNEDPSGYHQVLQERITAMVGTPTALLDRPGGVFIRRSEQMSEEDRVLLQSVARVIITDSGGTLAQQVDRRSHVDTAPAVFVARPWRSAPSTLPPPQRTDLTAFNGLGGFTPDGREYVITTTRDARTPAPWVNVLANPSFGTVVSESGSAYTWVENAHSHRLTTWEPDAVSDGSGEAFYIRDEIDGHAWSPTPLPAPSTSPYATRHGFGYSVFEHTTREGIASELRTYVAVDAPVKFVTVKLTNRSARRRAFTLTGVFDLVLGTTRATQAPHVVTEVDPKTGGLLASSAWGSEMVDRFAFLDVSHPERWVSGDRLEILGRNGTPAAPAFLTRARLSGRVGARLDPCMAMQVKIDLDVGQSHEVVFVFGCGRGRADARTLMTRFRGVPAAEAALAAVWRQWNRTLGAVHVETPDTALNHLANGWLVYQVLASRLWARSGFYQSGGAFGFRDQLQDAMALVHAEPALLREQIVKHAGRQFPQGDVQHWWHPPAGRGVRTRISDDFLWLPYAVSRYIDTVGDTGVLEERTAFIEGRQVKPDEDSYYDLPARSDEVATVYEHCVRAIDHGLRFGVHGLPLMGSGDWNDGMNLVGDHGKGESVWLAFFLHDVLLRFAQVAAHRGDVDVASRCTAAASVLAANVEAHAWDGAWYRRAYFDDGTPLGSSENAECQIDSLPQSWSVLSRLGDPARARAAMAAVDARLVRRDIGIVQLFDPPFDSSVVEPGYIRGYVPGVRENGGQYTHAAVWTAMAFAEDKDAPRAWEVFDLINPIRHGDTAAAVDRYKVEPYVVAADVYANPQHAGRGGWTWYSGSAGWMYRLITESLLGIHLEVDKLSFRPLLPASWPGFVVHYRYRETLHHIEVKRSAVGGGARVAIDGVWSDGSSVTLRDDRREHIVTVEVPADPVEPA